MTMAEKVLDCYQSQGAGQDNGYKRMPVLGGMRCQRITSHLSRLSLSNRLYNHPADPFTSPLFPVH